MPMFQLLVFGVTAIALWYLHEGVRGYVARRLRFVDAIQKPAAPLVAGVAATVVALPVVSVLPFIGFGTAVATGIVVGMGVLHGAREVRGILPP